MTTSAVNAEKPPRIWTTTLLFSITGLLAVTAVPWYGFTHGYDGAAWAWFAFFLAANGLSITGGYHRLWSHRAYEAHWTVRLFFMIFGTMAIQNSILVWGSGHRVHHRHVDDNEQDPYSANRGFWFSHIGWMLREYPSGRQDFSNAKDLQEDPIVMFQHNHYVPLVLLTNFGLPILVGWLCGDVWAGMLLSGVLRLVVSHHVTFFINSLCHIWGTRPYTEENTARDNPVLAVLTWGEGYHNYHHIFQYDYRNGVKWWQWDPTKWLILALSWVGLTRNLKRIPDFTIRRAQVSMQFKRTQEQLESPALARSANIDLLKQRFASEYEAFVSNMNEWGKLKEEWYASKKQQLADKKQAIADKKRELSEKWEEADFRTRFKEVEYRLKMQSKRLRMLMQQAAMTA